MSKTTKTTTRVIQMLDTFESLNGDVPTNLRESIRKATSLERRRQAKYDLQLLGGIRKLVAKRATQNNLLKRLEATAVLGPRPKRKNEPENNSKLSELEKMFENEPEPPSKKRKYTKKKATEDARDATTTTESLEETGAKKEESEEAEDKKESEDEEEAEAEDEDESDEEEAESESDMDKSEDEEDE